VHHTEKGSFIHQYWHDSHSTAINWQVSHYILPDEKSAGDVTCFVTAWPHLI